MKGDRQTITAMDVQRYQQLRQLSRQLMSVLTKTIPREAMLEMGDALGILRENTLLLDTLDVSSVLMDSCLFDWLRDGKNLVQRYVGAHPPDHRTDEHLLLQAYCRAKYRLLTPKAASPGAVTYLLDTLSGESIALMDIGLSQSMAHGFRGLLATRTAWIEGWWMTTGAPLPIGDRATGERVRKTIQRQALLEDGTSAAEHRLATAIIRTCLDAGVAAHVRYLGGDDEGNEFGSARSVVEGRNPGRHIDRNEPCPCGSGKRYRRCCMHK